MRYLRCSSYFVTGIESVSTAVSVAAGGAAVSGTEVACGEGLESGDRAQQVTGDVVVAMRCSCAASEARVGTERTSNNKREQLRSVRSSGLTLVLERRGMGLERADRGDGLYVESYLSLSSISRSTVSCCELS